jgi:hypothetical protein
VEHYSVCLEIVLIGSGGALFGTFGDSANLDAG